MSLARIQMVGSIVLALGAVGFWLNGRRRQARYGRAFHAYNEEAFVPIVEPAPDKNFLYVTRLAHEFKNEVGQRAISVAIVGSGMAVHHINHDGTFTTQGPYFIAWRSRYWHSTGAKHIVKTIRGKEGWGFKPDHPNQDGTIREKGIAILEYYTQRHSPIAHFAQLPTPEP